MRKSTGGFTRRLFQTGMTSGKIAKNRGFVIRLSITLGCVLLLLLTGQKTAFSNDNGAAISLAGPSSTTSSGQYQYTATGGVGPYTWSVAGFQTQPGFSIDNGGNLALANNAGGSFRVTVRDSLGALATLDAQVTNNGHWDSTTPAAEALSASRNCPFPDSLGGCDCYQGHFWITQAWNRLSVCLSNIDIGDLCGCSCNAGGYCL